MAGKPATPAQIDQDTPIPLRYGRDQKVLTETLLALPTFPERLTYLLDEQSDFFTVNGNIVVDPAMIDTQTEGLTRHSASAAFIAEWVQHHSKATFSRAAISQLKKGLRPPPRTAIANALAEFWRIDPRLLDPAVPAERFADAPASDDTDIPPSELTGVSGRMWELMNQIGLESVRPREISKLLGATTAEHQIDFLDVLEAIHKYQRDTRPTNS
ncbi:hypothetical protein [Amycolatopsis sp. NBC_01480]|uniref:hypothetical protein n=1 Tax=Amycolatopsis sp. NBC_01480 TaxID=2903562 RepID=UPI002E2E45E5|nr:hypothetical protein [Amycolatopsis sp. NBC_01480]